MTDSNKKLSDEQYWKQYKQDEDGGQNHPISIDVAVTFKAGMDKVIFETKEKNINCNLNDLERFFTDLKRVIRIEDEKLEEDDSFE